MPTIPFPRQAYYERIGAAKSLLPLLPPQGTPSSASHSPVANLTFLRQLILAHTGSIPFETIDVLLGRRVSVAPGDIYDKLIHARRGGYCFEQNGLFLAALRDAGFTGVRQVAARVLWDGEDSPLGRTHMLNIVTFPSEGGSDAPPEQWMIDVGFGGALPRAPLRLSERGPQHTPAGVLRVRTRDAAQDALGQWMEYVVDVQVGEDTWRSLYHFDLQPTFLRDFYMMNYTIYNESLFQGSLQASRAEGVWVDAATVPPHTATDPALTTQTGYTYVPRGLYTVFADDVCKVAAKAPHVLADKELVSLPAVGGVLTPDQSQPATPGELYDWMADHLQIDFTQTRLPQHRVTRGEFVKASCERLKVFGGKGFERPHPF